MSKRSPVLTFTWFWFLGLFFLGVIPLVLSLLLSFAHWDGLSLSDIRWAGAEHLRRFFSDHRFAKAVGNTVVYTIVAVPLGLIVSLALALLLNRQLKGIALFRTVCVLPYVLGGLGTVLIWQWLFNPDAGLINLTLEIIYERSADALSLVSIELPQLTLPRWLHAPQWCKPSLILMHLWSTGGPMLIFLAALQNVPEQLYEAASLDGARRWHQLRHITLPQISPAILFNAVIGLSAAVKTFTEAYVLRHWSQDDELLFYMVYVYENAFELPCRLGYASAMIWLLAIALLILSLGVVALTKPWVYYEAE